MPGEQNSTTRTTHLAANGDGTDSIEPTPSNSDKDYNTWADQDELPEYEMIFW